MNTYINQYKQNEVQTSTPEKILILLYDGAIQFLIKAEKAMQEQDVDGIHTNLVSCQKIILEFMSTINMEEGGDFAARLYNLYDYFYRTLVDANMKKDLSKVKEVLEHLKSLRDTWTKAIEIANAEKAQLSDSQEYEDDDEDIDKYEHEEED